MESRTPFSSKVHTLVPRPRHLAALALGALAAVLGCGGNTATTEPSGGGNDAGGAGGQGATSAGGAGGAGGAMGGSSSGGSASGGSSSGGDGGSLPTGSLCGDTPPPGSPEPAPLPVYTGGVCPTLVAGENNIMSDGNNRLFVLVLPEGLTPEENPPILFLWHWLGGSAEDFIEQGQIQAAVDQQRFVAVVPRAKGDGQFQWPFTNSNTPLYSTSDARMEEEFTFFDDMLSCVGAQYKGNLNCVGSAGVSAGALFTDQLAGHRAEHISSFLSLSGGTGGSYIRPWGKPARKLPGLVLWGGPTDTCAGVFSFEDLSMTLEDDLTAEGNFLLECIHNCGHSAPPIDPPADGSSIFSGLWGFFLAHPFWLNDGDSPYKSNGLPPDMPDWCGIGKASATPREGPCSGGGC